MLNDDKYRSIQAAVFLFFETVVWLNHQSCLRDSKERLRDEHLKVEQYSKLSRARASAMAERAFATLLSLELLRLLRALKARFQEPLFARFARLQRL